MAEDEEKQASQGQPVDRKEEECCGLWGQRRPSRSSEEPAGREGKGRASQQEAQHVGRS